MTFNKSGLVICHLKQDVYYEMRLTSQEIVRFINSTETQWTPRLLFSRKDVQRQNRWPRDETLHSFGAIGKSCLPYSARLWFQTLTRIVLLSRWRIILIDIISIWLFFVITPFCCVNCEIWEPSNGQLYWQPTKWVLWAGKSVLLLVFNLMKSSCAFRLHCVWTHTSHSA